MARKEVEIAFTGKDESASSTADHVLQKLKMLKAEARASGENALEKTLNNPGGLAQAGLQALGLGVAGVVADQVGKAFDVTTEKLLAMQEQMREGKANAADLANAFALSIPILGSFVSGWENVRELLTGEKEQIAEINEETDITNKLTEARLELAQQVYEQHKATLQTLREIHAETALIGNVGEAHAQMVTAQKVEASTVAADSTLKQSKDAISNGPKMKEAIQALHDFNNKNLNRITDLQTQAPSRTPQFGDQFAPLVDSSNDNDEELGRLLSTRKSLQDQIASIQKDHNDALAKAEKDHASTISSIKQRAAAEDAQSAKEIARERLEAARQADNAVAKIQADAEADRLTASGHAFEAQRAELKAQVAQEKSDAMAATQKGMDAESDPLEKVKIWARGNAMVLAQQAQGAQKMKDLKTEELRNDADAAAQTKQKALAAQGKFGEAELVGIKQSYADQIATAKTSAQKVELAKQEAVDVAESKRKAKIDERDHAFATHTALQANKIADLEEKGALSTAAKREAIAAQAQAKSEARLHGDQKIIDDIKSSAAEKQAAREDMQTEKANEVKRQKMIATGRIQEDRRGVEGLQLGNGFTGIAVMFKAGGEPGMAGKSQSPQEQAAEHAKVTQSLLGKLIAQNAALLTTLVGRGIAVRGITLR